MARWWSRADWRGQQAAPAVPAAIVAGGIEYRQAWRSEPTAGFHKAEYVPHGQDVTRFDSMILLDVLDGGGPPGAAALAQAHAMNEVNVTGHDLPHELRRGSTDGEVVLDFVVQAYGDGGEYVAEFAVYRYLPHVRGLVLFGYVERGYGEGVLPWFEGLAARRLDLVGEHMALPVPDIG